MGGWRTFQRNALRCKNNNVLLVRDVNETCAGGQAGRGAGRRAVQSLFKLLLRKEY